MVHKWRAAMQHCKEVLEINTTIDLKLGIEEKQNFEKCIVENYLVKFGDDYFGKRDLLYIDLWGDQDVRNLQEWVFEASLI